MKLTDAELAEKVAVEVMGWEKQEGGGKIMYWVMTNGFLKRCDKWNPCTDWNDMKLIVNELFRWEIYLNIYTTPAGFLLASPNAPIGKVQDKKLGRAVCIAALKAKGVDV